VVERAARKLVDPKLLLALTALVALGIALVVVLGGRSGDGGGQLQPGDKVKVAAGERAGGVGAVTEVSDGSGSATRYRVRLTDLSVHRFDARELREQPLVPGDWVRALGAGRAGGVARVARVAPRGTDARYIVELADGSRPRLRSDQLAFITTAEAPAPFAQPSCEPGATAVTSPAELRGALEDGRDACVKGDIGDVDLSDITAEDALYVGTEGTGEMGFVEIADSAGITLRARLRSTTIRDSRSITIENSVLGGTERRRVLDQLVFIPEDADDVTIRDSDLGWTTVDDSGNTGYGLRVYGRSDRLLVQRNRIHHIGADGIQLGMDGRDASIDRNEIAYVAPPQGADEHSDDIQVTGHGPNLRITNNYLHHNGWLDAGGPRWGGSGPYIHAGDDDTMLFQNNLVRDERNFMQVGNLGTGGRARSNLTFRRNTFYDNGTMFPGSADLSWRLSGGEDNRYERNLVIGSFWNEFGFGSHTRARENLEGRYRLDARGNCTSAACNPRGQEPIGYRKPANVRW
jgi:hypothetical protein